MAERTHFSVGSYSIDEIGAVTAHATKKGLKYEIYQGPIEDRELPGGGPRLTVLDGMTAVVLRATLEQVDEFWEGFDRNAQ